MKQAIRSQDVLLLLKLVSIGRQRERLAREVGEAANNSAMPNDWRGWLTDNARIKEADSEISVAKSDGDGYSVRALQATTGISKSEVSSGLRRCQQLGLVRSQSSSQPFGVNTSALLDFIVHGLKYVFPAQVLPRARGIPTATAAPVLAGKLFSPSEAVMVWPDAWGSASGEGLAPLHKSATKAVRGDADLYAMLALVDAIRVGDARETAVAKSLLAGYMGRPK